MGPLKKFKFTTKGGTAKLVWPCPDTVYLRSRSMGINRRRFLAGSGLLALCGCSGAIGRAFAANKAAGAKFKITRLTSGPRHRANRMETPRPRVGRTGPHLYHRDPRISDRPNGRPVATGGNCAGDKRLIKRPAARCAIRIPRKRHQQDRPKRSIQHRSCCSLNRESSLAARDERVDVFFYHPASEARFLSFPRKRESSS